MTPERWQRVKELFEAAQGYASESRAVWLDEVCAGDAELRREVETLLAADEQTGEFLDRPAISTSDLLATNVGASVAGQRLGAYILEGPLGHGGMGVVFLARDDRLGRPVAVKLLQPHFTRDAERVRRFQQEARAASALNHPNILTIYETGEVDGAHFIATEFVEGKTLRELLADRRPPLAETLDIVSQAAGALAAAHASGIIHRDIKPENIMLRPDGYVKVLDFGLAKLSEHSYETRAEAGFSAVETNPGTILGTYTYMSPEQARGYEVDARTDVFSLGVVLYEMLTGQEPFIGPTSPDVVAALLNDEPLPLERFDAGLPVGLQQIVDRALKKDRAARYQQIDEMLADLKALRQRLEMESRSGAARRSAARARPHRPQPAIAVVLALTTLTALFVASYFVSPLIRKWRSPASVEPIRSLAVLPFKPLVATQSDEVLEMGMADTLIARLSSLKQASVPPINAVRRYRALDQDPVAAGRELQVEAVLEGSILRAEDKIRVTVRLIRVEDGALLWTRQFDERWTDIFAVQDAVSQRLAADLLPTLTGEERTDLARGETTDPEAYELYLTGRHHWNKRSSEGIRRSIEYFSKAIDKDSRYALAHVGLADAYATLASYRIEAPKVAMAQAEAAAGRALSIDPRLAEAHASMGKILAEYRWDWRRAESEFRLAIELKPKYANSHHWYSSLLVHLGRFDEAVKEAYQSLELDHFSPVTGTQVGQVLYRAGRCDEAISILRKTLDLEPTFVAAGYFLGHCLVMQGRAEEAIVEFQKNLDLAPETPDFISAIGRAYVAAGRRAEALKRLEELKALGRRRFVSPFNYVGLYAALGDPDRAFDWLEKCFEERDGSLRGVKTDPILDPLRHDPRFAAVVRRAGFEP